jgi:hypothetical protein
LTAVAATVLAPLLNLLLFKLLLLLLLLLQATGTAQVAT